MSAPIAAAIRRDIPGRFNELDILRRHRDRYTAAMKGHNVPPHEVMIHGSSVCNLTCDWCIGDHVPMTSTNGSGQTIVISAAKTEETILPDGLRDPGAMARLASQIINFKRVVPTDNGDQVFGIETVNFSGLIGEPLVNRASLIPAIKMLNDAGLRTGIFTNGILIGDKDLEVMARMGFVHVSMDAATGDTYAKLKYSGKPQGVHLFKKALESIRRLRDAKDAAGTDLQISVGFIVYPGNFEEVYESARQAKERGAMTFKIKRDISCLRLLDAHQRSVCARLIDRIEDELADETFEVLRIHDVEAEATTRRQFDSCRITKLMASIGSDGNMYPCNYHPRPGAAHYGSVIEDSLEEVWDGTARSSMMPTLPQICPPTCDPFKGRSNTLFQTIEMRRSEVGDIQVDAEIDEIIESGAYRVRHITE
ncbi:radical SAM protein [Promicromonospora sp. NPDC057488]|uniref:radical SAM protein n=1 Tax=Promicromonospora sp. NPDC057488 TaxID=3346147 RepID=UPI00366CC408